MANIKPTILIITGGWVVPASYSRLTSALQAAGYDVQVPRLPSMNGARPPNADLTTDTEFIRSKAENLVNAGKDVIVLMHSYGGQVGTNALHGLGHLQREEAGKAGGVKHLIYMLAAMLLEGGSMRQASDEPPAYQSFAEDGTMVNTDPRATLVGEFHDLEEAEIDEYLQTLGRWNGAGLFGEIKNRAAWREISISYIHATHDMVMPLQAQQAMVDAVQKEGKEVRTFTLETGHCPDLTATKEVVDVINKIAERM